MAAHSTQAPWLPQLPPSTPALGMAAVLDANDNNKASDAARPERERATGPSSRPYAKLAVSLVSGAQHSQHNQDASPSGQAQDVDRSPQNRYHSHNHHHHHSPHNHYHNHNHNHNNPTQQKPTYEASDASTPSRTRSTSSSNFTPLSSFPSSTSRAPAIGDHDDNRDPTIDIDPDPLDTVGRAEHVHVIDDVDDTIPALDHVHSARLHPFYLYPSSQQQQQQHEEQQQRQQQQQQQQNSAFLSAPSPQPHSLLASPQLCLRSRSRRSGRTGASSHSRSRKDSHSRRPSLEKGRARHETTGTAERVRAYDVTAVDNDNNDNDNSADNDNDNDNDDGESLDSHALAWDQTCLRIAYLVSTMVTPSSNVSVGGGGAGDVGAQTSETLGMARSGSPGVNGVNGTKSASGDAASSVGSGTAAWQLQPEMLDHFVDLCTKGWAGAESSKKRRKIAQILHWQNEVSAHGEAAYCGCADGSPVPNDSVITATEPPLPSLQTTSTSTSASVSVSTASASGEIASAIGECVKCPRCAFTLTPKRPIVWVADPKDGTDEIVFKKVRRTQESPGDSIRKAFKSFRGLVFSKKNKRSVSSPAGATVAAMPSTLTPPLPVQPPSSPLPSPLSSLSSPILDKATMARRAWCQWEELNCQRLRDESDECRALFFPQTAMYQVREEDVEVSKPASVGAGAGKAPGSMSPSATQAQAKEQAPVVVDDNNDNNDNEDDEDDDDEYDPEDDASQVLDANDPSAEQRRQRETNARLRRAEKLLKKINDGAATTAQAA